MRKFIMKTAGWLHASLIMAAITPLLYTFGAKQPDNIGQSLYYKCLLIALPIVVTDYAVKKCKGLLSYLIISAFTFAVTALIGSSVTASLNQSPMFWVYMAVLLSETIFVIIIRISDRLRQKEEDDIWVEAELSWRPSFDSLSAPSFWTLIFFAVVYVFAVNLNNPTVCNVALFSAIIYTLVTFLYKHVSETEKYLALNKRTCNIPSKRIYGIGNGMLAIFLLLFVIMILPALLTISSRHYHDIRNSPLINTDYTHLIDESEMFHDDQISSEDQMWMFDEAKPVPEWVNNLVYIFGAIIFILLIVALVKFIYNTFHAFRGVSDENGDIVEELQETDEGITIKKPPVRHRKLSERERIRKEYRRFIRRYRKERPARYESPTEIERNAGIAESEENKKLHKQYELARYGQES